MRKYVNDKYDDDRLATFYAGFLGGFSLFFYDRASFRTLALYMFARLLKAIFRAAQVMPHYLGASVTVEVTPLFNFTPNVFINLTDPSALAQLVFTYDWKQDIQLLGAFNFPIGPNGSEYGGIESTQPGLYVSTGPSLFAQLAWYF